MAELITSVHNPKIKQLLNLHEKSSLRRELGLFVVEGVREMERCAAAGFELDSLFICPEITEPRKSGSGSKDLKISSVGQGKDVGDNEDFSFAGQGKDVGDSEGFSSAGPSKGATGPVSTDSWILNGGHQSRKPKIFEVIKEIYSKIAYRESTEGIIAEFKIKDLSLQELKLSSSPLIVVLESVEKPGNLGAVLRSADAAGADAVIVCDPLTDLYNPNLIRASLGARFSVQCSACTSSEAISWLKAKGIRILTAQLQDSSLYYDTDMKTGTAIVIGAESSGLSDSWRKSADAHIKIPMSGTVDSLNASVSAAILLFEAVRQRKSI